MAGLLDAFFPPRKIQRGDLELTIMDMRGRAHRVEGAADLDALVANALVRISAVKQGFGELVADHVGVVAFMDGRKHDVAYLGLKGLLLSTDNLKSAHMLACKLIWGATILRVGHDKFAYSGRIESGIAVDAAKRAQLHFIRQFPDWEPWAERLDLMDLVQRER